VNDRDFIVVDTEGKDELNEIAIIDCRGKIIYEAFVEDYPAHYAIKLNRKSLADIVRDFQKIARDRTIICHWVQHDRQVLKKSFLKVHIPWQEFNFKCSHQLAQQYFPQLCSYSLEYLSKQLNLKIDERYFDPRQAHSARYDALFT
jgi:DNA polymerase III epsilon subunit-like protein